MTNYTILPTGDRTEVERWLLSTYKPDRLRDTDVLVDRCVSDIDAQGWTLISHHDARSGLREVVMVEGHHSRVLS